MSVAAAPRFKMANLTGKTVRIKSPSSAADADGYMTLPPDPGAVHVSVYQSCSLVPDGVIRKVGGPAASAALGWRVTPWSRCSLVEHRVWFQDVEQDVTAVLVSPATGVAMACNKWTNQYRTFVPQNWDDTADVVSVDALFELNNEYGRCSFCGHYHETPVRGNNPEGAAPNTDATAAAVPPAHSDATRCTSLGPNA